MANLKSKYPISDGWLHTKLHLEKGATWTQEQFANTWAKGGEITHFSQRGSVVTAVYREANYAKRMASKKPA